MSYRWFRVIAVLIEAAILRRGLIRGWWALVDWRAWAAMAGTGGGVAGVGLVGRLRRRNGLLLLLLVLWWRSISALLLLLLLGMRNSGCWLRCRGIMLLLLLLMRRGSISRAWLRLPLRLSLRCSRRRIYCWNGRRGLVVHHSLLLVMVLLRGDGGSVGEDCEGLFGLGQR